mmetsp:Transcript_4083/g.8884  ORF Transcript_4083/g.8884 Transcript_4083/m.8884 type:complete len:251 (+) Transcript_4083:1354-2106(+)
MLRIRLCLLQVSPLVDKLIEQFLQDFHDVAALKLIGVRLWCSHVQLVVWILSQEGGNRFLCLLWNQGHVLEASHLRQAHRLLAVIGLCLEHLNGALQGINRLGVVLVEGLVVCLLQSTHLCRCLDISSPGGDVGIMTCDLLCKAGSVRAQLRDLCRQHINLLLSLLDGASLFSASVITELLVGSELHLLLVLLLLTLRLHACQHFDDLLHRCDGMTCPNAEQEHNYSTSLHWTRLGGPCCHDCLVMTAMA